MKSFLNLNNVFSNLFGVGIIGGFTLVVKYIVNIQRKRKEKTDALTLAVKSLLHNELFTLCTHFLDKGSISVNEYRNLKHLHSSYMALGGDVAINDLMNHIRELLKGGE